MKSCMCNILLETSKHFQLGSMGGGEQKNPAKEHFKSVNTFSLCGN